MSTWNINGQYMETCNCAFLCPCITSNLTAQPTEGDCKAALALHIDSGEKDGVKLGGLSFILMLQSPGPMGQGNIAVGLIVDDKASPPQVEAIRSIATGSAGGPMAMLAPLVGRIAGVEQRPIRFEAVGLEYSVSAAELVNQACEGLESVTAPGQAIGIDNVAHPVNSRLSLARATRSSFHAFGIDWEDATGLRNGHFAPFAWAG
jgi:hypothetical protein